MARKPSAFEAWQQVEQARRKRRRELAAMIENLETDLGREPTLAEVLAARAEIEVFA